MLQFFSYFEDEVEVWLSEENKRSFYWRVSTWKQVAMVHNFLFGVEEFVEELYGSLLLPELWKSKAILGFFFFLWALL